MKDKKTYIILGISILFMAIGISYAYFSLNVIGNDNAKNNKIVTGNLELTYTDTNEISLDNAFPGDSFEKTISVKNTGTKEVSYNIVWTELTNEITNNELVIEATCKRLNSSGTEEGTCNSISQTPVSSNTIKKNILIETNITHKYTIKVTFLDTGSVQNYNKNKSFSGKLGINEYKLPTSVSFSTDSWDTIVELVKAGKAFYNVGNTKEIDMGTYGTHTLRVANTSTPSECSTTGFSQTACGFVLEFADIITKHKMNDTNTNIGGWPATNMRTFVNNDIYNSLPADLKNAIIDTTVISSHGSTSGEPNFTSTDKLYFLSPKEIYTDWSGSYDSAKNLTRTLDYYTAQGVTHSNYSGAIKKYGTSSTIWQLRTATINSTSNFLVVYGDGSWNQMSASATYGVSPAFRIG